MAASVAPSSTPMLEVTCHSPSDFTMISIITSRTDRPHYVVFVGRLKRTLRFIEPSLIQKSAFLFSVLLIKLILAYLLDGFKKGKREILLQFKLNDKERRMK